MTDSKTHRSAEELAEWALKNTEGPVFPMIHEKYREAIRRAMEQSRRHAIEECLPQLDFVAMDGNNFDNTRSYFNGFQDAISGMRVRLSALLTDKNEK